MGHLNNIFGNWGKGIGTDQFNFKSSKYALEVLREFDLISTFRIFFCRIKREISILLKLNDGNLVFRLKKKNAREFQNNRVSQTHSVYIAFLINNTYTF